MRNRWTPEQKADALDLLATVGKAEAARRTGIPAGTIASWGHRGDVQAPSVEAMRPALEAKAATLTQRRQALGEKFLTKANELLAAVATGDDAIDRKRGVEAAKIAAEAAQLLTGGLTANLGLTPQEPVEELTTSEQRQRALAVVHQLADRSKPA